MAWYWPIYAPGCIIAQTDMETVIMTDKIKY